MGKWLYRKPEASTIRGTCVICKIRKQKRASRKGCYKSICAKCHYDLYRSDQGRERDRAKRRELIDKKRRPYRQYVEDKCSRCGFTPKHICQLDVDHIDSDHTNNAPENLQTLCANCHRLKTHLGH